VPVSLLHPLSLPCHWHAPATQQRFPLTGLLHLLRSSPTHLGRPCLSFPMNGLVADLSCCVYYYSMRLKIHLGSCQCLLSDAFHFTISERYTPRMTGKEVKLLALNTLNFPNCQVALPPATTNDALWLDPPLIRQCGCRKSNQDDICTHRLVCSSTEMRSDSSIQASRPRKKERIVDPLASFLFPLTRKSFK
jgi:hypothetical protein